MLANRCCVLRGLAFFRARHRGHARCLNVPCGVCPMDWRPHHPLSVEARKLLAGPGSCSSSVQPARQALCCTITNDNNLLRSHPGEDHHVVLELAPSESAGAVLCVRTFIRDRCSAIAAIATHTTRAESALRVCFFFF